VGWLALDVPYARPLRTPKVDDTQVQCGLVIAKAILSKKFKFNLESILNDQTLKHKLAHGEELLASPSSLKTDRSYYIISYNDGLFGRFRGTNIKGVLASAPSIPAFGPQSKEGEPWNNKQGWTHPTPTLILRGSADPLSEQDDAEYFLNYALTGDRILVEFPGIGHSMAVPDVSVSDPEYSKHPQLLNANIKGSKETKFLSTRDKLIDEFLNDSLDAFKNSDIIASLERAFERCMYDQAKMEILVPDVPSKPFTVTPKSSNLPLKNLRSRLKPEPVG
jgi:hypothetical protein